MAQPKNTMQTKSRPENLFAGKHIFIYFHVYHM